MATDIQPPIEFHRIDSFLHPINLEPWQKALRSPRQPGLLRSTPQFLPLGFLNDLKHHSIDVSRVVMYKEQLDEAQAQRILGLASRDRAFGDHLRHLRILDNRDPASSNFWLERIMTEHPQGYFPQIGDGLGTSTAEGLKDLTDSNLAEVLAYRDDAPDPDIPAAARGQILEGFMMHGPLPLVLENRTLHVILKTRQ